MQPQPRESFDKNIDMFEVILVAKSFFLPPLTIALSPRWGERG